MFLGYDQVALKQKSGLDSGFRRNDIGLHPTVWQT